VHCNRGSVNADSRGALMTNHQRMGANFRGLLNDLKRRPQDAAKELGLEVDAVEAMLSGTEEIPQEVITKATELWPVNARDFYLFHDDTPHGVKIMRAEDSVKTSRVMERDGSPYYDYRDTVMSSVASFRPEWIQELCVVDTNDPENPSAKWNNGHFMHQFTYFVGPVNFYYRGRNGEKKVAVMNTGDTMYITPFVSHTFTTRKNDKGEKGLILALTYGDKLSGDAQQELAAIGPGLAENFALDFSTREKAFAALLRFHREAATMTVEELAQRLNIPKETIENYESSQSIPDLDTVKALAQGLNINCRDLLPPDSETEQVIVCKYKEMHRWSYPSGTARYQVVELASTARLPYSKAIEVTVQEADNNDLDLRLGLHQYGYNVGNTPFTMNWELNGNTHSEVINPGDTLYIKPFVKHNYRGDGKLLLLRIGGYMAGDPQREFSTFDKAGVERVLKETKQWFNPG